MITSPTTTTFLDFPLPPSLSSPSKPKVSTPSKPILSSPSKPALSSPPKPTLSPALEPKKRARTRNQYIQQTLYPSPSSPFTPHTTEPLNIRRRAPSLSLKPTEADGGGMITELKILLLRDAGNYGFIVHRLLFGSFPAVEGRRRAVEEECGWLGMEGLRGEIGGVRRRKSMVHRGGEGYI